MFIENLGEVTIPESTTIGTTKQYSFEISARMSLSDAQNIIAPAIGEYAINGDVTVKQVSSGFLGIGASDYVFSFIPLYAMALSDWRMILDYVFENYGASYTLNNVDVGAARALSVQPSPITTPVQNIGTYYKPIVTKVKTAVTDFGSSLTSGFSNAANYVKVVAIAGAVIVGGVLIMNYVPKPQYKSNPRRRRKHYA